MRYLLDPKSKAQNESDLQKLIASCSSIAETMAGLELLKEWKSGAKAVEGYREAAAEKWPQATAFQR